MKMMKKMALAQGGRLHVFHIWMYLSITRIRQQIGRFGAVKD